MIDSDGYRLNIGIILCNQEGQLFWAKRVGQNAWQFPQGGIKAHETPKQALFRELHEEIGLTAKQVEMIGATRGWLRYRLPANLIRYYQQPLCIGQKQIWYLLRLLSKDSDIHLDAATPPEFENWIWVDYWYPLSQVIYFKRKVYETALKEFSSLVVSGQRKKTTPSSNLVIVRKA
jgi:putative (di)nucleoside polyphosphate hydrolase